LAYQWYRNGVPIAASAGGTGETYALVAADYTTKISLRVTATLTGYLKVSLLSPATTTVVKGTFSGSMAVPTVANNTATGKLTATLPAGSITDSGVGIAYQWYRNGVAISLATKSTYTLTAADIGREIKVRAVVTKANYTSVVLYSVPLIP
jgi:hypothetical protein